VQTGNEHPDIRTRLAQLEAEQQSGEALLKQLAAEEQRVRDSLLRISGAIQVLRELLAGAEGQGAPPA
jgi:hypothetical protein